MIFANYIALYSIWPICEYSLHGLVGFLSNALIKLHRKTLLCASRPLFCNGRSSTSKSTAMVYLAQALLKILLHGTQSIHLRSASSGAAQCPGSLSPVLLNDTWHPGAGSKRLNFMFESTGRRVGVVVSKKVLSLAILLTQLNSFCRKTSFTSILSQVPTIFSSMSMPIFASLCLSSVAISACR